MASKVMVKLPVAPFGQVNKPKSGNVTNEMVPINRQSEIATPRNPDQTRGSDAARVAQLEQNIRFLQEQHQLMLTGLHKEIDNLRHKNRELQFQLVFVKGSVPSSPSSSSEDDTKQKVYSSSPKSVNITPLQVELLEKELGELKLHMHDVESQNMYLSAIVEEQKKKLEHYERERERECERAAHPDPELIKKLDETEALVRKLHQENTELRRENSATSASANFQRDSYNSYYRQRSSGGGGGGVEQQQQAKPSSRHRNGGGGGGNYKGNWFPPLQSQSFWQGGRPVERNGGGVAGGSGGYPPLPNVQGGDGTFPTNQYQQQGRRNSNNNHYRGEGNRKYRGGQNRGHKQS